MTQNIFIKNKCFIILKIPYKKNFKNIKNFMNLKEKDIKKHKYP